MQLLEGTLVMTKNFANSVDPVDLNFLPLNAGKGVGSGRMKIHPVKFQTSKINDLFWCLSCRGSTSYKSYAVSFFASLDKIQKRLRTTLGMGWHPHLH